MKFEWDARKANTNYKKHGVRFSESLTVFEDDYAITIPMTNPIPASGALYRLAWG
jgi:uncharacterized DUF497 family protein